MEESTVIKKYIVRNYIKEKRYKFIKIKIPNRNKMSTFWEHARESIYSCIPYLLFCHERFLEHVVLHLECLEYSELDH